MIRLVPLTLIPSPRGSSMARSAKSHVVFAGDGHSLAARAGPLVFEAQDRLVGALALQGHVAHVKREGRLEVELALAKLDHVAGLGVDQGRLSLFGRVRSCRDFHHIDIGRRRFRRRQRQWRPR